MSFDVLLLEQCVIIVWLFFLPDGFLPFRRSRKRALNRHGAEETSRFPQEVRPEAEVGQGQEEVQAPLGEEEEGAQAQEVPQEAFEVQEGRRRGVDRGTAAFCTL